ncbi:MAG TPA: nitronate monooxygenase [Candidatus Elarobacter sp.]
MSTSPDLRTLLGTALPIVQAPMAGGFNTPDSVAAASNAGVLGSTGAAYLTPAAIREHVAAIRARTASPFSVNLFAGGDRESHDVDPAPMLALLAPLHERFGLPPPVAPGPWPYDFGEQLAALVEVDVRIVSFTFGLPSDDTIARLRADGRVVIGTATNVAEALRCEAAGCSALIAQGTEAGGHRGTFIGEFASSLTGLMALVPMIVDAVKIPVLAAGGIMDRRGVAAARALGASGVVCGTAFMDVVEAGTSAAHRRALATARDGETVITRAFSGRPARGLANTFERAADARPDDILPYPKQNALTRPLRTAAAAANDPEYLSLWAGQATPLAMRGVRTADVVAELAAGWRDE